MVQVSGEYRTLSKAVCKVLHAIWQLEVRLKPKGRGATRKEIARMLGWEPSYVARVLSQVHKLPVAYVEKKSYTPRTKEGRPGAPLAVYYPRHDNLTTVPETAVILLELLKFEPEQMYFVDRNRFAAYVNEKMGFDKAFTQRKIDWALEVFYISNDPEREQYITPRQRINCEKKWLEMVAREYKPNRVSGRNQKGKTL